MNMNYGIATLDGAIICDPIPYDHGRFISIVTRYSGNPAALPVQLDTNNSVINCGTLQVLPSETVTEPQPKAWGYQTNIGPWQVQDNAFKRVVSWQALSDLEALQNQACDALAEVRYNHEVAGITLENGAQIATDRESQSMLASAYQSLSTGLMADTDWKAATGWATVTEAELKPIAAAVALHVRACFRAERAVAEQIATATTEDLLVLDVTTAFIQALNADGEQTP